MRQIDWRQLKNDFIIGQWMTISFFFRDKGIKGNLHAHSHTTGWLQEREDYQIEVARKHGTNFGKDSQRKEVSYRNTIVKCENKIHELDELMYQFLDNIKHVTKRLRRVLPENKREMVGYIL
jgi:hypothetical protein